jgi:hypothetical protein
MLNGVFVFIATNEPSQLVKILGTEELFHAHETCIAENFIPYLGREFREQREVAVVRLA